MRLDRESDSSRSGRSGMAVAIIPSTEAELAVRRIKETLAGYSDAMRAASTAAVPPPRVMLGAGGAARQHAEDAVLRLVAIAEYYATAVIVADTEARLDRDGLGFKLWDLVPDRFSETWPGRIEAWKKLFGLTVTGRGSRYESFEGFIDARNALAHGLGNLTRKQVAQRQAVLVRLATAGIALRGDAISVDEATVVKCAATAEAFVLWVDQERHRL